MKFRKKPVVIEAYQWDGNAEDPNISWLHGLPGKGQPCVRDRLHNSYIGIRPGDWIITGIQGERYPCKPDVFAATYEPAD